MFYEEKMMDGVLMCRNSPIGYWVPVKQQVVDMSKEIDHYTALSHIILEHPSVQELAKTKHFNDSCVKVDIKMNGIDFSPEDFNAIMESWYEQAKTSIKEELDFDQTQNGVITRAEKLLKEKMGNVQELLDQIENDSWKIRG